MKSDQGNPARSAGRPVTLRAYDGGMSERSENRDVEGSYLEMDEDQLQPEDTLINDGVEDVLDRGYSPPDREPSALADGRWDDAHTDTIEERIEQEVPDPTSAYGAPDGESGEQELLGGDDPDAIPAEDDWEGEIGEARAGRLVAPDEGYGEDTESDVVADDVGIDGAGASAEEAAVHVVGESDGELDLERDLDIEP